MTQEQDIMSTFKRLTRINKEGGSMTAEERTFFETTKKKNARIEAQARSCIQVTKQANENFF